MKLLGKGGLLEDIKRNLRYSDWSGGLPFQWNEDRNILERKSEKELHKLGFRLGLATVYFILALINVLRVLNRTSLMVITHSILMLGGWTLVLSNQFTNYLQLSGVVQLCNGFIQLEHSFSKHFGIKKESYSTDVFLRGSIYVMTLSGITMPIVIFLDILRNPCFPAFAGHWMSCQCDDSRPGYYLMPTWTLVEVLTKVIMSFAAYLIWSPLVSGSMFQMSLEYIVEGNCFRVFIDELGK